MYPGLTHKSHQINKNIFTKYKAKVLASTGLRCQHTDKECNRWTRKRPNPRHLSLKFIFLVKAQHCAPQCRLQYKLTHFLVRIHYLLMLRALMYSLCSGHYASSCTCASSIALFHSNRVLYSHSQIRINFDFTIQTLKIFSQVYVQILQAMFLLYFWW